jgi:lipid-binding SYLF domain-containing protein
MLTRSHVAERLRTPEAPGDMVHVKLIIATTVAITVALTPLLAADDEPAKRLDEAAAVFSEIIATPDKGIPQELIEKAHCIVIVPELRTAAFVVGGKYGKGYLS